VFRGPNEVKIDQKGRIVIPSHYRERLYSNNQAIVVLTIDTEAHCLLIYPLLEWEQIEEKLAMLPSFKPAARRIQRLLLGHATDVEMDSQGRILIPMLLREYAKLSTKGQAILVGQGKKFELWDKVHWNTCRQQWLQEECMKDSALPDEINNISL
jgi:MraZ protein